MFIDPASARASELRRGGAVDAQTHPEQVGKVQESGKPRRIEIQQEDAFHRQLGLEMRRSERSHNSFLLLLIDISGFPLSSDREGAIVECLARSTRETDIVGWIDRGDVLGVIYTEVSREQSAEVAELLMQRTRTALASEIGLEGRLNVHIYPEEQSAGTEGVVQSCFLTDTQPQYEPHMWALATKRAMDIVGSLVGIILALPVMLAVAIAVKVSSQGSILFRQRRIGLRGKTFTFLKFRSMKPDNDPSIHQEFMDAFIKAKREATRASENGAPLFKIPDDPRVTPVGRFIRRTSLDELPQFFNVLKGDMSLVGPRPPIPYEVNRYDVWHRRRYLSVKPGLTGLWQVHGRSRTTFDEMVRLDLQYARSWTIWMDIKILLKTPWAAIRGEGAL